MTAQFDGDAPNGGGEAFIENVTFEEIQIGQTASLQRTVTREDIELYAAVSGDINPAHVDEAFATDALQSDIVAHGMWTGSLVSALLATVLPGAGTVYLGQDFRFRRPISVGELVTASVTAKEKRPSHNIVQFECRCVNRDGKEVLTGTADVIAPTERQRRRRVALPRVHLVRHDRYEQLLRKAGPLPRVPTAVVHPCHTAALRAVVEAVDANLIEPVLIGPRAKIDRCAREAGIDLARFRQVSVEHSHEAVERAIAMARDGEVDALLAGSVTPEEMMPLIRDPDTGLCTGRRMSHVFVVDVPTYPRTLLITDAVLNLYPNLDEKVEICQNAIDLAHVLGIDSPKVAVLSAVETVNARIQSTLDASALCKMADRGQIKGAVLDGPLAFDNAISEEAARTKGIQSPVAGNADILLVPDVEAGSIVAKQLSYMSDADSGGIVLGARVPILLASLVDNVRTRLQSCAVAAILANKRRDPNVKIVG